MAGSLNRVTLIGNLGHDPEIRKTNDGKEIAAFSLATTETWRDKHSNEKKEKTEWHRIVVFNDGIVNIIKSYVKKGSKVLIEGSLQTRKWQDSSGQEKYTTEIILQNYNASLILLDSKSSSDASSLHTKTPNDTLSVQNKTQSNLSQSLDDDDLPF
ncbi:single-stranded DNA-binding protein [Orientia tsutsugamushi]|uniref:Single-stranded DNA-binding protein n=1 Tax=Orientia tsutsugamushi TaxID=784 RepID=A0A2U3RC90_ORITS|nr:single-stranded DNA-binding protein [Orientia tsutsugamushi]KJV92986.1 single-stranded DNA-binding protein [Orientia tsutsugamushi str. UT76]SPR10846.1 single-stranded DNA-binding protein [Orientia tsutsugamushi]